MEQFEDEDCALVQPSMSTLFEHDEGDIEDGELWGDVEDNEREDGLIVENGGGPGLRESDGFSVPQQESGMVPSSQEELIDIDQNEHNTFTMAKVLTVLIAKWSYRFNVTATALDALLKLLKLFSPVCLHFLLPFNHL